MLRDYLRLLMRRTLSFTAEKNIFIFSLQLFKSFFFWQQQQQQLQDNLANYACGRVADPDSDPDP